MRCGRAQESEASAAYVLSEAHATALAYGAFPTEEWSYYLGDRLMGVGYVHALPEGLSAIYFYWAPAEAPRSLGTFNILQMIEIAKRRRLTHVHLGYFVDGCRSLEHKARFRPNEMLGEDRRWRVFIS